ncbi:MAG: cytochrome b561 domain-containing protein [Pseudomonadota bacterium]
MEWLFLPIDATREHAVDLLVAWHGRLMVAAWAVLFPIGILAARYYKIMPRQNWPRELDNKSWWWTHLTSQYLGAALVGFGLLLVVFAPSGGAAGTWHQLVGWVLIGLCSLQLMSGWLRGSKGGPTDQAPDGSLHGDHYDMTLRRRIFEHYHKTLGYLALALSCWAIVSGLWLANAPVWMWLVIAAWWVILMAIGVVLQHRGRCVDTYQAIWGNDPALPGNQRRPIGWGVRRPSQRQARH